MHYSKKKLLLLSLQSIYGNYVVFYSIVYSEVIERSKVIDCQLVNNYLLKKKCMSCNQFIYFAFNASLN